MKSKSVKDREERTFVLILDQGEEAFKAITEFANREALAPDLLSVCAAPKPRA